MKSLKTKVILSAVVLIFALVATIGSTFAWFTVSNTVTTSNLTLNVISADSLLIKLANYDDVDGEAGDLAQTNPVNYAQLVTLSDANLNAGGYFTAPDDAVADWRLSLLTAVQSDYVTVSADPADLNTMDPMIASNATRLLVNSPSFNTSNGGAIQLKFWVMSQSEDNKYLRLSDLNLEGTDSSTEVNNALEDSVRVSVYSTLASNGYIYMQDLPATAALASYDYDFAFTSANSSTYWSAAIYNPGLQGFNGIEDLTLGLDGSSSAITTAALEAQLYGLSTSNIITLVQNVPQLLTVTIWIEGWDAQATNLINTAALQMDLAFTIVDII